MHTLAHLYIRSERHYKCVCTAYYHQIHLLLTQKVRTALTNDWQTNISAHVFEFYIYKIFSRWCYGMKWTFSMIVTFQSGSLGNFFEHHWKTNSVFSAHTDNISIYKKFNISNLLHCIGRWGRSLTRFKSSA